jgi:hypothetical protein
LLQWGEVSEKTAALPHGANNPPSPPLFFSFFATARLLLWEEVPAEARTTSNLPAPRPAARTTRRRGKKIVKSEREPSLARTLLFHLVSSEIFYSPKVINFLILGNIYGIIIAR